MKYSKLRIIAISLITIFLTNSCQEEHSHEHETIDSSTIEGSWKLLTGTIIKGEDTTVTDYTVNQDFIKIINKTHFAFMRHDLGKDSTETFLSGGGRSEVVGNKYIEHLDYCSYRKWEYNTFEFEYEIVGDTMITTGIEKIESLNVNQLNIEQYIRLK